MTAKLWERRRAFRIPISGKALLQHDGQLEGMYDVEDVSIDGCGLVDGPSQCEVGSKVSVTVHVDAGTEIALPARVVRKTFIGSSLHLGLCFTHKTAAFEDLIQDLAMRSLEHDAPGDILVVHAHPERENMLFDAVRALGHRIVAARTPRDAVAVLEGAAEHIRMAFVSPVVGASRSRDIMKLIMRRFPHVHCVLMSRGGAQRLVHAIRQSSMESASSRLSQRGLSQKDLGRANGWSLTRLRKIVSMQEKEIATA